jgi:hypothetical protein
MAAVTLNLPCDAVRMCERNVRICTNNKRQYQDFLPNRFKTSTPAKCILRSAKTLSRMLGGNRTTYSKHTGAWRCAILLFSCLRCFDQGRGHSRQGAKGRLGHLGDLDEYMLGKIARSGKQLMKMRTLTASPSLLKGYRERQSKDTGKRNLALLSRVMTALIVLMLMSSPAGAQSFQHVVIVVQENRTPDNLFQGLCAPSCGPYNIQQTSWKNLHAVGGVTTPQERYLVDTYDLGHVHKDFTYQYGDGKMDGADLGSCAGTCPPLAHFAYVKPSDVQPYLDLAGHYGWANYMFQTNQGPSAPAHPNTCLEEPALPQPKTMRQASSSRRTRV